jgi:hypothetical protein
VNRSGNRTRIIIKKNRINLVSSGQLGSNVPAAPTRRGIRRRSHGHGRLTVGNGFRFHTRMTARHRTSPIR